MARARATIWSSEIPLCRVWYIWKPYPPWTTHTSLCPDVPVAKGISQPLTPGARLHWGGYEGTETDFSDIESALDLLAAALASLAVAETADLPRGFGRD